tara:strand:+ start:7086 stop:8312 length:1227 start_codon:yes stop_codon:yes gene_type:complete
MELIFILLLIIFYILLKNIIENELLLRSHDNFKSISDLIFTEDYYKFKSDKILYLKNKNLINPMVLSDFKFSESYKLSYELSKLIPLNFESSNGMFNNLEKIQKNGSSYQLCFCTENDIYEALKKKIINKNNINIVCSFFRMEFLFFFSINSVINNISKLKKYINDLKKDNKKLKFGILNDKHSSYYDGIKILNILGINEKIDLDMKIYDTYQNLFKNFSNNNLDFIYLTTTSKNKYLIDFFKENKAYVIGLDGINENSLKIKFRFKIFKTGIDIFTYNKILFYNNSIFSLDNSMNNNFINTFSTRLFLVCRKELDSNYVYNLTKSIYKNKEKLNIKMYKYFLTNKNNILYNSFTPWEMFFFKNDKDYSLKYHDGAKKYYIDKKMITYKKNEFKNNNLREQVNLFNFN